MSSFYEVLFPTLWMFLIDNRFSYSPKGFRVWMKCPQPQPLFLPFSSYLLYAVILVPCIFVRVGRSSTFT